MLKRAADPFLSRLPNLHSDWQAAANCEADSTVSGSGRRLEGPYAVALAVCGWADLSAPRRTAPPMYPGGFVCDSLPWPPPVNHPEL